MEKTETILSQLITAQWLSDMCVSLGEASLKGTKMDCRVWEKKNEKIVKKTSDFLVIIKKN